MSASHDLRLAGWLAVRGVLANRRENLVRLSVSVLAVVIMLLGCCLQTTALARSARVADAVLPMSSSPEQTSGVRVRTDDDYFEGTPVQVVSLARVGDGAPTTYDGMRLPEAGELVASPALVRLLGEEPELARRYPGAVIDRVPNSRLVGPDALVVWRYDARLSLSGEDAGWLGDPGEAQRDEGIASSVPDEVSYAIPMLVIGFLLPLLALIALLATLGGARREQRLAALRLVGLTDRHAKVAAALEDGLLSLLSLALGGAIFGGLVPLVARRVPVEGGVWVQDVAFAQPTTILLLVALPLVSVLASLAGLRALSTSPLGVERSTTVRQPRWWRAVPLVLGLVLLVLVLTDVVNPPAVQAPVLMVTSVLLMVGLAGSLAFAASAGADLVARRSGSLPALLVARRIQTNPSRATRVGVGLTLMIILAGPLLVFFPLIADVGAPAMARLQADVGRNTLVSYLPAGASTSKLSGERSVGLTTLSVQVAGRPDETPRVLVADCAELAAVTSIRESDCRRGLVVPEPAGGVPSGRAQAVEETVDESSGTVRQTPRGEAFSLPADPVRSAALGRLEDMLATGATMLVPASSAPGVPLDGPATRLTAVAPSELERVRSAILLSTGATSLTVGELHEIASRTTRELQLVAVIAALLIVCIAGFATLVTAYEHVRNTVAEQRLLTIGGAPRSLFRRALLLHMFLPTAAGVIPAVALSLVLALGFVRLLTHTVIPVPVAGITLAGLVALLAPLVATLAVIRIAASEPVTVTGE